MLYLAEEVEDASLNVPRAIWWSYLLNIVMGTAMLITMLFCIGPLDAVIDSATPYLILFQNTGSNAVTYVLLVTLFLLIMLGNITALAATSREVWAFSRDKGLPASTWISKVQPFLDSVHLHLTNGFQMNYKRNVPDNAVYITSAVAGILCLINLGSSLAFQIIVSLSVIAMLSTYMISIGCVLRKRLLSEPLPPARWSLGRWGILVNTFAFMYSGFVIIFSCFPTSVPVTTSTANWAPAVWVGVTLLSWVVYIAWGQKRYTAPVIFVEGRRVGGAEFQ
jgi:amino acid transporter